MSVNPVRRKLAAILAADAVGYSRLMAADEEGTVKVLAAHRAVIDGIIQFHEGRIVNTAGDSVLAEFASPTQAVRCAVEIQDALKTRNDALPEDRRLDFRIGVNLGDVMVKGEDLLGDGVNVAARLESIAEPGHINISSSVYDQIAGKLDLGFVDLGEQSLKNIDRPVRAYRVERGKARPESGRRPARRGRHGQWLAVAGVVVALAAGIAWFEARKGAESEQAQAARARAEAEIAKARAEAEAAKRSAEDARRALDEQRAAETRARAQAELANARADAEATRRKADAELAAAAQARRSAESAARAQPPAPATSPAASASPVTWTGAISCGAFQAYGPGTYPVTVVASGNSYAFTLGVAGKPGYLAMKGTRQPDDSLILSGDGFSTMTNSPYPAKFDGRFSAERFRGRGLLGSRDCALALATGATAARDEAARAALPGKWLASFSCAALGSVPPSPIYTGAFKNGARFEARRGKEGEVGHLRLVGQRAADGRMQMTGEGISNIKEYLGSRYRIEFDGRFVGDAYESRGKLGSRDCALRIARK